MNSGNFPMRRDPITEEPLPPHFALSIKLDDGKYAVLHHSSDLTMLAVNMANLVAMNYQVKIESV